ncbi:MAG: hypothetical protein GY830_10100 [Bacteroidetes bacterium]|nr:hypothetical protein [Bacteroidota bacterium]
MLKKILFFILISFIINCNNNKYKNSNKITKANNYFSDKASKYLKRFNNNIGNLNRAIKNSILPSFLLYNNLFSLSASLNESFIVDIPGFNFDEIFQYLTVIDSETVNYNHFFSFVINQTDGEVLDSFIFNSSTEFFNVINTKKISLNPNYFATISAPFFLSGGNNVLLNRHNFTDIIFSKQISLSNDFSFIIPFLANNNSMKLVFNFEDYFIFSTYDSNNGEILYNKSYELFNNTYNSLAIFDMIEKDDQNILLGLKDDNSELSFEGVIFKIQENLPINNSVNFRTNEFNISAETPNGTVSFTILPSMIPLKIIRDREDFIVVGIEFRFFMGEFLSQNCFVFKINSDFTKILNSKIINDTSKPITCSSIVKKNDTFLIGGSIGGFAEPPLFLFITELNSLF